MKFAFLAGGFTGFALATAAGFSAGRAPDLILRDAALACLAGALLLRWFWSIVIKVFSEAVTLKRAALEAEAEALAASQATPVAPTSPAKTR
ncbi:MAG TPA: hypothetical protein PLN52_04980 [Opitutaceae bacterium]|nr:hypothetical protein [Opitutaceae bacterium]